MSNKVRVSVLLEPETIAKLEQEAKEKSISLSAIIRQKVMKMITFKEEVQKFHSEIKRTSTTPKFAKGSL